MPKPVLPSLSSLSPEKGEAARPEPLPAPTPARQPVVGFVPPDQRTAMTYRPRLAYHRRLKMLAVERGVSMQDILDTIVEAWIDAQAH